MRVVIDYCCPTQVEIHRVRVRVILQSLFQLLMCVTQLLAYDLLLYT